MKPWEDEKEPSKPECQTPHQPEIGITDFFKYIHSKLTIDKTRGNEVMTKSLLNGVF